MRKISKILLAGAAPFALAGAAYAAGNQVHVLNVALPDGSVAHVRYVGEVAPRLVIVPARQVVVPVGFVPSELAARSTMIDRMMAQMDAQANAMLREAASLAAKSPAAAGQVRYSAIRSLPAGTVHYSFFSSSNGANSCTRAVQVTSLGANQPPKVVTRTSGNCANMPAAPAVGSPPAVAPQQPRSVNFVPLRPFRAGIRDTI